MTRIYIVRCDRCNKEVGDNESDNARVIVAYSNKSTLTWDLCDDCFGFVTDAIKALANPTESKHPHFAEIS